MTRKQKTAWMRAARKMQRKTGQFIILGVWVGRTWLAVEGKYLQWETNK